MSDPVEACGKVPPPRYFANGVNVSVGAYDATLTFIEGDMTDIPEDRGGPFRGMLEPRVQVVMPLGHLKSMIPLFVRAISDYESRYGIIPAPGFEEDSKG